MNDIALHKAIKEPTQVVVSDPMLALIERASRDKAVDMEKMVRLWELRQQTVDREASLAFDRAMSEAQAEMRRISADAQNQQTRSKYATYAQLDRAVRDIYSGHGFALQFNTGEAADLMVNVLCRVSHSGGYSRDFHVTMPADGKGARGNDVMTRTHATGSAITYGRRYLLQMIFNLAIGEDDDDGNAAGRRYVAPRVAQNVMKNTVVDAGTCLPASAEPPAAVGAPTATEPAGGDALDEYLEPEPDGPDSDTIAKHIDDLKFAATQNATVFKNVWKLVPADVQAILEPRIKGKKLSEIVAELSL